MMKRLLSVYCLAYLGLLILVLVLMCIYPKLELHLLLNAAHTPLQDVFFKYYSMAAEGPIYVLALLPLLWKKFRMTLFFAMSEVTGGAIVQILKHAIPMERPVSVFDRYGDAALPLVQGVEMHYSNSFPSGHTSTFFVFFTCCAIIMAYRYRERGCRKGTRLLLFHLSQLSLLLLAALGAYSRIYLSQHFLQDVCAGSIIGIVCPFLVYRLAGKKILNRAGARGRGGAMLLLLLMPLTMTAQDLSGTVYVPAPKKGGGVFSLAADSAKGKPALLQPLYWVKTLIDSSAIATVDRDYIGQPKRAWSIEARTSLNQATMRMETTWDDAETGSMNMWTKTDDGLSASAGLWVGYRGYGIGYSNIHRLSKLPLEIIKIDKSLVDEMFTENGQIIIRNTVRMMQDIHKELVIEGVETRDEMEALAAMSCDFIQGYYYSKPLPPEEFVRFVGEHNRAA